MEAAYKEAVAKIERMVDRLTTPLEFLRSLKVDPAAAGRPVESSFTQAEYEAAVEEAVEYTHAGDVIQVVPSQRLRRKTDAHPFQIYRALRSINPSPYMYYLELGDIHIVGASIETLVRAEDGVVVTHPIAGTRPRGSTPAEDAALEEELKTSEKQRAEHIMLVDLARNDVGPCQHSGFGARSRPDVRREVLQGHASGVSRGGDG